MGAALTTVSTEGVAVPRPGHAADGRAEDVDGKVFRTSAFKGRPIVVVYEAKDSKSANTAFKSDLTRLMKEKPLRDAVVVAAVADVSEYDSWPAKGFVKDAIRDEQKKTGTTIWCDWDASFRKAFDLTRGKSNVLVLGRDGRVRFAAAGARTAAQRASIEALLRAAIDGR
jgi:predicted transcriptional regulator